MAIYNERNMAIVSRNNLQASASVDFQATSELGIDITKKIDRPEELYHHGDQIVFTITLKRAQGITGTLNQITLTDTVPNIVKIDKVDIVQGTKGNITIDEQKIKIENLVLSPGNDTIIVEVTGTIVIL